MPNSAAILAEKDLAGESDNSELLNLSGKSDAELKFGNSGLALRTYLPIGAVLLNATILSIIMP